MKKAVHFSCVSGVFFVCLDESKERVRTYFMSPPILKNKFLFRSKLKLDFAMVPPFDGPHGRP